MKKVKMLYLFCLLLLMVFTVVEATVPSCKAEITTVSDISGVTISDERASSLLTTFLNQVAGINTAIYHIAPFKATTSQIIGSQKQQTCISTTLGNNNTKFSVAMILIDGKVRLYDLSVLSGSLPSSRSSSTDALTISKTAISNYETCFNANYCAGFSQAVPASTQAQNLTINDKNAQIDIKCSTDSLSQLQSTQISWYQTNGLKIPQQSVQATISKTGIITSFADNLGLYRVATTNISISKDQAIALSMPYISAFAAKNSRTIESTNATLVYVSDFNGTRGDACLVYPQWDVSATFNTANTDDDGYSVLIWADTGQIHHEGAQGTYRNILSPVPFENSSMIALVAPFLILTGLMFALATTGKLKAKRAKYTSMILLASILLFPLMIEPCTAYPSNAYGSRAGVNNEDHPYETVYDSSVASYLSTWAYNAGMTANNFYGSDTTESNIIAGARDQGSAYSINFYIGHGNTDGLGHYEISDDSGLTQIWDGTIYWGSVAQTIGHHKFAMIWACEQGDQISGMPHAWLHTSSLSSNGYTTTDSSCQCFVGWNGGAPYLDRYIDGVYTAGYAFLYNFYYYALNSGFTVHAALYSSAQSLWSEDFTSTEFYQGGSDYGHMVVYGDSAMYVFQRPYTLSLSCDSSQGFLTGDSSGTYDFCHTVHFTAYPNDGHSFSYWQIDGNYGTLYSTDPDIYLSMTADATATAVFDAPLPTLTLCVRGYEAQQVDCDLYVDSSYVGTGYASLQVSPGDHTIYVDTPYWFSNWEIYQNGNYWYPSSNPQSVTIYSDTSATAWVGA
jgi:hypothetical protein